MKDNNYFTIKKLFYLCCIASIIISIWFKFAKAEEMNEQIKTWCYDYLDEHLINYPADKVEEAMSTCPYFAAYSITDNRGYVYYFLDFLPYENMGIPWNNGYDGSTVYVGNKAPYWNSVVNSQTDYQMYYSKVQYNKNTNDINQNITVYRFTSGTTNNVYLGGFKCTVSYFAYDSYSNSYGFYKNGTSNTENYGSSYDNPFSSFNYLASYGNAYIQNSKNTFMHFDNSIEPINSNTDGFKVFKTTRSGTDYIIFDALNAVPQNIKNGEWYLTDLQSLLQFDLITETSTHTFNYSFDIDDASDEFPYNGEFFKWKDSYGNLYFRWEIPFSELNLPDDSYGYINNVSMTLFNDVSMPNNVIVPYLGLYHYFTNVNLYGTQQENNLNEPDDTSVVVPNNPVDNTTRARNLQSLCYGTVMNMSSTEYQTWLSNLQTGVIYWEGVYTTSSADLDTWLGSFPWVAVHDIIKYINELHDKNNFLEMLKNALETNTFTSYADYMVFIYNGSDADHSYDNIDVYVYETAKGRQKAISFLLDTSNTYFDKQFDLLRDTIPYIKNNIDNIDSNLFNFAANTFSQNNSIINNLEQLLTKFDNFDDAFKDFINRLFNALSNLHLSQLDTIETKLTQILNNLPSSPVNNNEDDTIQEAIQYYLTHTQLQAVSEDKYSVWFTGYCHYWLQSYDNQNGVIDDSPSTERRRILLKTFESVTSIYDKMKDDNMIINLEEFFDYLLGNYNSNAIVSEHRFTDYFTHIFDINYDLDYNPYEVNNNE